MDILTLAHPLEQHGALPLSPVAVTALAVCLVAVIAVSLRPRHGPVADQEEDQEEETASWAGRLGPAQAGTRVVALLLLVLAIAAGRLGSIDELENLAPALVVGAAWPLLLLASALIGPIWRWLDPWDTVARLGGVDSPDPEAGRPGVLWALPAVGAWAWYLSAYPFPLAPRAVGTMLGLYSIVTVAGCFAVGRGVWLAHAEPLGLLLSWTARVPRRRLVSWRPPRGAEVVLGALAGGLLFGSLRASELWGALNVVPEAAQYSALGVAASCVVGGALLWSLERWSSRAGAPPGTVAAASVPATVAIALALALGRNRLFTSLQLLPGLFGDPFGLGWDLFGPAVDGLDPAPLGVTGLALTQLAALLVGHAAGAAALARRAAKPNRLPALLALFLLLVPSSIAIASS